MVLLPPPLVPQPLLLSTGRGAVAIRVQTTPRVLVLSSVPLTNTPRSSSPPPLLSAPLYRHLRHHQPLPWKPRASSSSSSSPASAALSATPLAPSLPMAGDPASPEKGRSPSAYEEALNCLSSLITKRQKGDGSNRADQYDLMPLYVKMLDLEDQIEKLKVIHVAGTKGKGSTCSFTESILRSCGFRTGLFTSPHLIDVRERFKLDGMEISEEKFLTYFWWCWHRFQEQTNEDIPMPTYFRFLALLAFKIFSEEQVDVTILEVGLGGRFDATNVVKRPVVCGVSSLGYDHMEILGNTLGQIAGEKAGIFKENVPAYTVPQPKEAMLTLENRASKLGIPLTVVQPIDIALLKGQNLGLDGEHQYTNAGLAVALCRTWLKETAANIKGMYLDDSFLLPEQFIRGLITTRFSGRAQIVPDLQFRMPEQESCNLGGLVFYLDGAHSPESMEVCARWFSHVIKNDSQRKNTSEDYLNNDHGAKQILLFNCMSVRDPQMLLPKLFNACSANGVHFQKALFVPSQSLYYKVGSYAAPANDSSYIDLSWQKTLQRVWENLVHGDKASPVHGVSDSSTMNTVQERKDEITNTLRCQETSTVFSSLPSAIRWLRETAQKDRSVRLQVLVTGSLHLVGDVLRLIKR